MNAELQFKKQRAQLVPEDAVVSFENRDYVFLASSALKFAMTEVRTGEATDGKIAVVTDLTGKKIVLKGAYSLLMKLKNTTEEE